MSFLDSLKDSGRVIGEAGLETITEGAAAALSGVFGDSESAQAETHPPADVGEDGTGGTVAQQPTEVPAPRGSGFPPWVLPVGLGLAGVLTTAVVVVAIR